VEDSSDRVRTDMAQMAQNVEQGIEKEMDSEWKMTVM
jgi:hypothetical protein